MPNGSLLTGPLPAAEPNAPSSGAPAAAEDAPEAQLEQWLNIDVLLTAVYLAIFIVGVIGNVCNCLVIADSKNRYMKTATNYYLFSLSVSDLLLLIFGLPHDLINLWHPSPYLFNQFVCISRGWISEASTYASVLVIVTFTVERYLAICHPLRAHTFSRLSRAIKIIILIWLVASTCALVVVMQYGLITVTERRANGQETSTTQCTTVQRNEIIFELSVLIFFIIPMTVISILYIKLGYHLRQKSYMIRKNQQRKQECLKGNQTSGSLARCAPKSPRPSSTSQSSLVLAGQLPAKLVVGHSWRLWPPKPVRSLLTIDDPSEAELSLSRKADGGQRHSRSASQLSAPGEPTGCVPVQVQCGDGKFLSHDLFQSDARLTCIGLARRHNHHNSTGLPLAGRKRRNY